MSNIFTKHPGDIGETYFQHFCFASIMSVRLLFATIACLIHAFLPFLFINTTSNLVAKMTACFCKNGRKKPFLDKVCKHNPDSGLADN